MLTRKTINLPPPAAAALEQLKAGLQLGDTDVICRAIQVYAFIEAEKERGHDILIRYENGDTMKLVII